MSFLTICVAIKIIEGCIDNATQNECKEFIKIKGKNSIRYKQSKHAQRLCVCVCVCSSW